MNQKIAAWPLGVMKGRTFLYVCINQGVSIYIYIFNMYTNICNYIYECIIYICIIYMYYVILFYASISISLLCCKYIYIYIRIFIYVYALWYNCIAAQHTWLEAGWRQFHDGAGDWDH